MIQLEKQCNDLIWILVANILYTLFMHLVTYELGDKSSIQIKYYSNPSTFFKHKIDF